MSIRLRYMLGWVSPDLPAPWNTFQRKLRRWNFLCIFPAHPTLLLLLDRRFCSCKDLLRTGQTASAARPDTRRQSTASLRTKLPGKFDAWNSDPNETKPIIYSLSYSLDQQCFRIVPQAVVILDERLQLGRLPLRVDMSAKLVNHSLERRNLEKQHHYHQANSAHGRHHPDVLEESVVEVL